MPEKVYPDLPEKPSAPPMEEAYHIDRNPNEFRMKELEEKRKELSQKIDNYESVLKKTKTIFNVFHYANTGCSVISSSSATGSLVTLSTGTGIVVGVPLAAVAVSAGFISFVSSVFEKKLMHKIKKYERLLQASKSSYSTVATKISEALLDENISNDEYKFIMEEFDKHVKTIRNIKSKLNSIKETNYKHDFEAIKKQLKNLKSDSRVRRP